MQIPKVNPAESLIAAVKTGDQKVVLRTIEDGEQDDINATALRTAIASQDIGMVKTLFRALNYKERQPEVALAALCALGETEEIKELLNTKSQATLGRRIAFLAASRYGQEKCLRMMYEGNEQENVRSYITNGDEEKAYIYASKNGHTNIIIALENAGYGKEDTEKQKGIIHACNNGHTKTVEHLAASFLKKRDGKRIASFAVWASQSNQLETTNYILEAGNLEETHPNTTFFALCSTGQTERARQLKDRIKLDWKEGASMEKAIKNKHLETAKMLIKLGCDPKFHKRLTMANTIQDTMPELIHWHIQGYTDKELNEDVLNVYPKETISHELQRRKSITATKIKKDEPTLEI